MQPLPARASLLVLTLLLLANLDPQLEPALAGEAPPVRRDGANLARQRCVACHAFPPPDTLPRSSWRGSVEKMSLIAAGREIPGWAAPRKATVLTADEEAILAYYEAAAPLALPKPPPWPPVEESPVRFVRRTIAFSGALTPEPAVSNVELVDLQGRGGLDLLATDMRQGLVLLARPDAPAQEAIPIAQVPHPAHVTVADLDKDGRPDLVVSDLGAFFPGDHDKGAVTLLRARPEGGYTPFTIGHLPRVADVEVGDFDGDGRVDLVVAAFGWFRTGEITVLLNRTEDWSRPAFDRKVVDARPGAIHVIPTDLDRDGKLDFVALLAQQYESVVAYLGDGRGGFRAQTLYAAPHPNWGSSGMTLVDFDGDGDLDVLVTNGDMFDDDILKPYHGIQWLENEGRLRFQAHPLAALPGAHRALAADLDGDGDLDVVASAFTGVASIGAGTAQPALVWLERTKGGRFLRHTLAEGVPLYATLAVGDVDGDGDLDLVTGPLTLRSSSDHWLEVWENQRRQLRGSTQ